MAATVRTLLQDAVLRRQAWTFSINALDPDATDKHFLHFRNTNAYSLMVLEGEISSTVAGNVEPFRATGVGGNTPVAIAPVSLSGPGGAGPSGTFERGVNLALTTGEFLGFHFLRSDVPEKIDFDTVIPPNTAWGLNWEPATGILTARFVVIGLAPDDDPA